MVRKNGKTTVTDLDPAMVAELFPDSDNDTSFYFDLVSSVSFGRIIASVAAMGGMVTVYPDRTDDTFCISIRFGERRKSYSFDGGDGDDIVLEQLSNRYHAAYAKYIATKSTS